METRFMIADITAAVPETAPCQSPDLHGEFTG